MEPHGHLARIPVSKLLRERLTCFIKVSIKVPINMPITLLNTIKIDHIKKHTLLINIKILIKQFYTIPIIPTEPKSLSFFSCLVPPHNPHLTFVPRPTFSPDLDRGPPSLEITVAPFSFQTLLLFDFLFEGTFPLSRPPGASSCRMFTLIFERYLGHNSRMM